MVHDCYDATLIELVLGSRQMTFRSLNVGSPVTFGREEYGNTAISSFGVDAVIFMVDKEGLCCALFRLVSITSNDVHLT
jgi:hypothetical protein